METFDSRTERAQLPLLTLLISMLIYTLTLYYYVSALISCLLAFSLDYVGSMSPPKIIFVFVYLLEDEQELNLGMLIRPKRIYNFCQFLSLFVTLLPVLPTLSYLLQHFPD